MADTTIKGCPQLMQVRLLATARSPLVKGAEYGVSRHLFCIEPDTFQIRSPRRLKAAPGVDTEPGPRRGTIPNRYLTWRPAARVKSMRLSLKLVTCEQFRTVPKNSIRECQVAAPFVCLD